MSFTIRPFDTTSDADWETWVAIHNRVLPEHTTTVEEAKSHDERRDPRCVNLRFLAETGEGLSVALGSVGHSVWQFHETHYHQDVLVLPEHEGKGYGRALYAHLKTELDTRNAAEVRTYVREDWERGVRFAQERGFVESMREWESRLDVPAFDPAPWEEARQRPGTHGIMIKNYTELADDPDRDLKVWELENETARDVPTTEEYVGMPYETYERMMLKSPNFLPEAFIIAVEEATGKYVGSSNLWKRQADSDLQTGLTAVLRDYRRKGIALAMKLRVIEYAQSIGCPLIRTENATTNRPMLSINEALGYVKQPVWIQMLLRMTPPAAEG